MEVINLETNEEDFNIIVYPPPIRRTTNMLTVSLFRGSDKLHEQVNAQVPQHSKTPRRLLSLAVIHEADVEPGSLHPKVMLYQAIEDPDHYWIRKENGIGVEERINYSETECEDAVSALGGFDQSVRLMLDRLLTRSAA